MKNIFWIRSTNIDIKKNIWLEPVNDKFNEREFRKGLIEPINEIEYTISRGKIFTDVIGNTYGGILFNKRLIDLLSENNIKGLDVFPAKIRLKKRGDEYNNDYFLVRRNVFCGDVDCSKSEIEKSDHGTEYDNYIGYRLDLSGVDKSVDFFSPKGAGYLHCSEKIVDLIKSMDIPITGIEFDNINDIKVNCKWFS